MMTKRSLCSDDSDVLDSNMSIKPTKRKREITAGVKVPRTPRAKAAPKEPVPTPEPDRKILVAVDL